MRQLLVPHQLVVLLVVVVSLSVIIVTIAILVPVFTTRVVGSSVEALFIFRRVVPSVVGFFYAVPSDELDDGIVAEPASLQEVGAQLGRGTVQIALRTDVAQAAL